MTIEEVESQLEQGLRDLLEKYIPKGYRARVMLADKENNDGKHRKKRKNASAVIGLPIRVTWC